MSRNGLPVKEFAKKYGKVARKRFAFTNANGSRATDLCIAAATSNAEFDRVRSELFARDRERARDVGRNGITIAAFARKHGNAAFQI